MEAGVREDSFHIISSTAAGPYELLKNIDSWKIDLTLPQQRNRQYHPPVFTFFRFLVLNRRWLVLVRVEQESLVHLGAAASIHPSLAANKIVLSRVEVTFISNRSVNKGDHVVSKSGPGTLSNLKFPNSTLPVSFCIRRRFMFHERCYKAAESCA